MTGATHFKTIRRPRNLTFDPALLGAASLGLLILVGRWSLSTLSEHLPDLELRYLALLPGIIGLAFLIRNAKISPLRKSRGFPPFLLLFSYLTVNASWSSHSPTTSGKVTELVLLALLLILAHYFFILTSPKQLERHFWTTIYVATGFLALTAVPSISLDSSRLATLGGGPNVFARLMAYHGLSALYLSRTTGRRIFIWSLPLASLLHLMAGSRGALLAGLVTILYLCRSQLARLGLPAIAGSFFVISAMVFGFSEQISELHDNLYRRFIGTSIAHGGIYTSGRDWRYLMAFHHFLDHPFAGIGLGEFQHIHGTYPHNLQLELLGEGGLIAFTLFLIPASRLFLQAKPFKSVSPELLAAFIFALVAAQFSGDLYDNRGVFLFLILASYCTKRADTLDGQPTRAINSSIRSPCQYTTSKPPRRKLVEQISSKPIMTP